MKAFIMVLLAFTNAHGFECPYGSELIEGKCMFRSTVSDCHVENFSKERSATQAQCTTLANAMQDLLAGFVNGQFMVQGAQCFDKVGGVDGVRKLMSDKFGWFKVHAKGGWGAVKGLVKGIFGSSSTAAEGSIAAAVTNKQIAEDIKALELDTGSVVGNNVAAEGINLIADSIGVGDKNFDVHKRFTELAEAHMDTMTHYTDATLKKVDKMWPAFKCMSSDEQIDNVCKIAVDLFKKVPLEKMKSIVQEKDKAKEKAKVDEFIKEMDGYLVASIKSHCNCTEKVRP